MRNLIYSACAAVFGAALLGLTPGTAVAAEKRVALIIGNSAYQNAPALPNPVKDANLIAEKLRTEAKFDDVLVVNNLGYLAFKRALQDFQLKAETADIAVIYYAGHGIEINKQNYLVPVDAKLATEIAAEDEAVTLDRMVQAIEPAKKFKLLILDACRDNPLAKTIKRRVAMRNAPTRGLGEAQPTVSDTLFAYATRPGSVAEDGEGTNSPFALALAKHLIEPGLDVRFAFGRIRDEVMKSTANRQEPYVTGSIGGEQISLNPKPEGPKFDEAGAKKDYELAAMVGTKKAFELYINQYKTGLYVEFAKEQIKKLDTQSQTASLAPVAPAPAPSKEPTTAERQAWERIKDKSNKADLQAFINRFPQSVLSLTAQRQLDAIEEREAKQREERAAAEAKLREDMDRQRLAALQKAEDERRAKATAAERANMDRACRDQEDRLANLKAAGNKPWVKDDLKRLERELSCERLRPDVLAALDTTPDKPAANTPAQLRKAQQELARIGCYAGAMDGNLPGTRTAANNYLARRNKPAQKDLQINDDFVASLGKEKARVCPLVCGPNQEAVGERCVASRPPAKKEEPKKQQAKKSEPKQEQRQQPQQQQQQARPIQQARPMGGGMVGVGF